MGRAFFFSRFRSLPLLSISLRVGKNTKDLHVEAFPTSTRVRPCSATSRAKHTTAAAHARRDHTLRRACCKMLLLGRQGLHRSSVALVANGAAGCATVFAGSAVTSRRARKICARRRHGSAAPQAQRRRNSSAFVQALGVRRVSLIFHVLSEWHALRDHFCRGPTTQAGSTTTPC